ncbi:MAG: hypothetical protein ACO29A_05040, partial [Ilumatobacteraceae bacterium]
MSGGSATDRGRDSTSATSAASASSTVASIATGHAAAPVTVDVRVAAGTAVAAISACGSTTITTVA